ncbi:MAG: hypothetical protein AB7O24_20670 [Kofleriaceae bacterium]
MTSLRFVVGAAVVVAIGCRDEQLEQLERVKAEVCACKTPECADAAMKKVPTENIESSYQSQRVAGALLDCLTKLYRGGPPNTDPDAPVDDPGPGSAGSAAAATPPEIGDPASAKTP